MVELDYMSKGSLVAIYIREHMGQLRGCATRLHEPEPMAPCGSTIPSAIGLPQFTLCWPCRGTEPLSLVMNP